MSPFVFVFLWVLALAVLVGWSWWRKWHRELAAARHAYHAAQQDVEAATVFYGSMQLDPALERHHVSGQNWREQTMTELTPEALDPGPGVVVPETPPPGPDPDPGPGSASLARRDHPGPDPADLPTSAGHVLTVDWEAVEAVNRAWAHVGHERLADTGDIRDAALLADTTTYMRDQDADVADWMARRAAEWARLKIGVLA